MKRCPGGDSQHSVPLHWAQKVSILVWSSRNGSECRLAFMVKPFFQVLRNLEVCGRACLMGEQASKLSQSAWYSTAVDSVSQFMVWSSTNRQNGDWHLCENCFSRCWKNLVVCGIVSSTSGRLLRWSQSALLATTLGSEGVYSWFDPVKWPKWHSWKCHFSRFERAV